MYRLDFIIYICSGENTKIWIFNKCVFKTGCLEIVVLEEFV